MDQEIVDTLEFGNPASNEDRLRILFEGLLGRVVDPVTVDARHARLHLELAVVDTRLVVDESSSELGGDASPVEPQVVGSKAHHHRSHTEVDPAGLIQASHDGIHQRVARSAVAPRFEVIVVPGVFSQPVVCPCHVLELDRGLVFQFLDEVVAPGHPGLERTQRRCPAALALSGDRSCLVQNLPNAECSVGDVRTQPRAGGPGRIRAGDRPSVVLASFVEKGARDLLGFDPSSHLRVGAGLAEPEFFRGGDTARGQTGGVARESLLPAGECRWETGEVAASCSCRPWPASRLELGAVGGPARAPLVERHAASLRPTGHRLVSFERDGVTGLFVGVDLRKSKAVLVECRVELGEDRHRLAPPNQQARTERLQLLVEVDQTLAGEAPVAFVVVGGVLDSGFDEVQRDDQIALGRLDERPMIGHTKISFEPHDSDIDHCPTVRRDVHSSATERASTRTVVSLQRGHGVRVSMRVSRALRSVSGSVRGCR